MQTTKTHGLNAARDAKIAWEDNRVGVTVYKTSRGFIASFWMHRDGPIYAEPVFETEAQARAACFEMANPPTTEPYRDPPGFQPGRVQFDKHRGNTVPRTADGKFPIYRP